MKIGEKMRPEVFSLRKYLKKNNLIDVPLLYLNSCLSMTFLSPNSLSHSFEFIFEIYESRHNHHISIQKNNFLQYCMFID
jgi:hypothetical protein